MSGLIISSFHFKKPLFYYKGKTNCACSILFVKELVEGRLHLASVPNTTLPPNMDRLSSLPISMIEHILEKLPQEDRVRTSVLSTKWRILWSQHPSLLLDREFHNSVTSVCEADYLYIVTSILLQRKSPARHLSLYVPEDTEIYGVRVFDHIIKSFWSNVHKLSVENGGRNPYIVPACVFRYAMSSTARLTHLQLRNCAFSPPASFQGFPSLVSFELCNCQATSDAISRFVSSCPTLEKLVLQNLDFSKQSLDIDAPQLRHLCVHGNFAWLFLINVDNIEVLDIMMEVLPDPWEGMRAVIPTFFNSMTKLVKIKLGGRFCELLARHSDSIKLARYDQVKNLSFVGLHTVDVLVYVWNSVKSFPNLTQLAISLVDGASGVAELKDDENIGYKLKSLIRVDFTNISGTHLEMKVIERLLSCTPALKLMSINFHSGISQEYMLNQVRQMMKFCRASNKARVDI